MIRGAKMKSIFMNMLLNNNLCVLCTCKNNIPDASLMQYICDSQCTKIYMLTLKESKKYNNIINNANVSLLIDTRDAIRNKENQIKAATIYGEASIIDDVSISKKIIEKLLRKHASLVKLASDINVCVVEIIIKSALLLESVDKSSFINFTYE